ncbi:MAG: RNA polymerase sigma factor [Eubacteriales bacterium]
MDDGRIVDLFWERSEAALVETKKKYDRYCLYIAENILSDSRDAEECVNDAYLRLWNRIPPHKPEKLSAFLGKIVRGLAIDRLRFHLAKKREAEKNAAILDEFSECFGELISDNEDAENSLFLRDAINRFLGTLEREQRIIFMQRYWYFSSIQNIAAALGLSESKVKVTLFRVRGALKSALEKEGFPV